MENKDIRINKRKQSLNTLIDNSIDEINLVEKKNEKKLKKSPPLKIKLNIPGKRLKSAEVNSKPPKLKRQQPFTFNKKSVLNVVSIEPPVLTKQVQVHNTYSKKPVHKSPPPPLPPLIRFDDKINNDKLQLEVLLPSKSQQTNQSTKDELENKLKISEIRINQFKIAVKHLQQRLGVMASDYTSLKEESYRLEMTLREEIAQKDRKIMQLESENAALRAYQTETQKQVSKDIKLEYTPRINESDRILGP